MNVSIFRFKEAVMEEVVYEPHLPFHVQVGEQGPKTVRNPEGKEWDFYSRHETFPKAQHAADVVGRNNEFVRVVKVT